MSPTQSSEEWQAEMSRSRQQASDRVEGEVKKYASVDDQLGVIVQEACAHERLPTPVLVDLYSKYWRGSSKWPVRLTDAMATPAGCPLPSLKRDVPLG